MKKTLLIFLALALSFTSCATIQQNIDARTYLAKCQYDFAGIQVTDVTFSSGILIDSVGLRVSLKITNPTDKDVALDHADIALGLDGNHVVDIAHKRFVRVFTKTSTIEPLAVTLPLGGIIKSLGHRPVNLDVHAKLWVTLLVGKADWKTPIVIPVDLELPIPYDQIDAFVAKQKKQIEDDATQKTKDALKEAADSAAAKAQTEVKKIVPSVPKF